MHPGSEVEYCGEPVHLSVCLHACISHEPNTQTSPNFLCMLPMDMQLVPWLVPSLGTLGYVIYLGFRFCRLCHFLTLYDSVAQATPVKRKLPQSDLAMGCTGVRCMLITYLFAIYCASVNSVYF